MQKSFYWEVSHSNLWGKNATELAERPNEATGYLIETCNAVFCRKEEGFFNRKFNRKEGKLCRSDQLSSQLSSWPPLQRYNSVRRSQMEVILPALEIKSRTITQGTARATRENLYSCPPPLHQRNKMTG